jgi:hypothetical protein
MAENKINTQSPIEYFSDGLITKKKVEFYSIYMVQNKQKNNNIYDEGYS